MLSYLCNGVEWSKDRTQAAESIKWRPQQAYSSNQVLLAQPQTIFSTHTKSSRSRIDKRTARATGNIVQELCESRGGRPGLSVLTSLLVSVDVKIY